MANRYGALGLDRTHNLKVDGFYQFDLVLEPRQRHCPLVLAEDIRSASVLVLTSGKCSEIAIASVLTMIPSSRRRGSFRKCELRGKNFFP